MEQICFFFRVPAEASSAAGKKCSGDHICACAGTPGAQPNKCVGSTGKDRSPLCSLCAGGGGRWGRGVASGGRGAAKLCAEGGGDGCGPHRLGPTPYISQPQSDNFDS